MHQGSLSFGGMRAEPVWLHDPMLFWTCFSPWTCKKSEDAHLKEGCLKSNVIGSRKPMMSRFSAELTSPFLARSSYLPRSSLSCTLPILLRPVDYRVLHHLCRPLPYIDNLLNGKILEFLAFGSAPRR